MESIYSLDETDSIAGRFMQYISGHNVIAFHGNLGAGKTTLIQAICKKLGVKENVSSPTFSIINQYSTNTNKTVYHIDLYRVRDNEEAEHAGVEECIYSGDTCFIEWPERVTILPVNTVNVYLEPVAGNKRKLLCKVP